jgi:hypothetical protein
MIMIKWDVKNGIFIVIDVSIIDEEYVSVLIKELRWWKMSDCEWGRVKMSELMKEWRKC